MKLLPLTNDNRKAMVNDEDFATCSRYRWHLMWNGYVRTKVQGKAVYLAHLVMFRGGPRHSFVDHVDGNPLNNCRENLRIATNSQNQANRKKLSLNTSGYRGVTWHRACGKWQASIKVNGKTKYLGLFADPLSAAKSYDKAAIQYFGDFANPNVRSEIA